MNRRSFFRSALAFLGLAFTARVTAAKHQNLGCPWCETVSPHLPRRVHGTATEFRCQRCKKGHTRKAGQEGMFAFFPGDIERMASDEVSVITLPA
ncbi:MAG TPA: hypothetical protein VG122_03785 [Gemmata sp.]|jgi:hypothetical protein|nr:hypothetical protein [Gemmata sp.]